MAIEIIEDVIPGSIREEKLVKAISSELGKAVDWLKKIKIPVVKWRSRCRIVVNGVERECRALPYSPSTETTGKPRLINNGNELAKTRDLSGEIVIMEYPSKYIGLRKIAYIASSKSPSALVLVTSEQGLLKINTVFPTPGFTHQPSIPMPMPVICVDKETGEMLKRSDQVIIETKSSITEGEGTIVIAGINGSGDEEIHVITHHDHWFRGIGASYVGLLILVKIAKELRNKSPYNLALISYTAREIGDKLFTEYHYTWGERYLLEILDNKRLLERVKYAIAIGPVYNEKITVISHPCLEKPIHEMLKARLVNKITYNHAFRESLPYIEKGVPALTFTTIDDTAHTMYNSNIDNENNVNYEYLAQRVAETILALIKRLRSSENFATNTMNYVKNRFEKVPLEARISVSKLMDISMESGKRYIHILTRTGHGLFYLICRDIDAFDTVYAGLFPALDVLFNTDLVKKALERCNEVIIGDGESYGVYPISNATRDFAVTSLFNKLADRYIHKLDKSVNKFITLLLCEKAICGETSGVEKHNDK